MSDDHDETQDQEEHGRHAAHQECECGHEEGGGHAPLWIVSFADMVILLMSFFVILFSMSTQRDPYDKDLLRLLASIKAQFGYKPNVDSKDPLDLEVLQVLQMVAKGKNHRYNPPLPPAADDLSPEKTKSKKVAIKGRLGEPIFFKPFSEEIPSDEARKIAQMADIVRSHYRFLTVLGHCSPQESKEEPDNGHNLAFRRAVAISNALIKHGISAPRLRLVSCAAFETAMEDSKEIAGSRAELNLGTYFLPEKQAGK